MDDDTRMHFIDMLDEHKENYRAAIRSVRKG